MFDVIEQVKEMENVKNKMKDYCVNIANVYNKYSENKINMEGSLHSVKIKRLSENVISVKYNFIRDFGNYVLDDPNDEGDRHWEENLKVVENVLNVPETVFFGLTEPDRYSLEYVEEEIKCFAENEMKKIKKEEEIKQLFDSFKSFSLTSRSIKQPSSVPSSSIVTFSNLSFKNFTSPYSILLTNSPI